MKTAVFTSSKIIDLRNAMIIKPNYLGFATSIKILQIKYKIPQWQQQ
jgi:hypothetical protein